MANLQRNLSGDDSGPIRQWREVTQRCIIPMSHSVIEGIFANQHFTAHAKAKELNYKYKARQKEYFQKEMNADYGIEK